MTTLLWTVVAAALLALCTLWILLGLAAVLRATRSAKRRRSAAQPEAAWPPVTVLKPLCGADPGLAENLRSFFAQDYPHYQLVMGVERPDDPAIRVVRELQQRYPEVCCKLIVHRGARGINPKVRNLRGMLPAAESDLLLISDSNVRAPAHYLREMVQTLRAGQRTGLVTNLFAGAGERSLGAALENVQLNGFCAAGATLPTALGDAAVVGKSMLFSRAQFERLGGFGRVADVLAEDFVIGKMFQHAGYRVRIAATVLDNVTTGMSLGAFLRRHLRWSMLRWRLRPLPALLEPVSSPLAMLPVAWWLFGPALALGWTSALWLVRDVGGWLALRGRGRAWLPALLSPLRDGAMLAVWLAGPLRRHVAWRGHRVRLGAGTLLFDKA